ncbi:hypothetical protein [Vreelandella sp. GE22]
MIKIIAIKLFVLTVLAVFIYFNNQDVKYGVGPYVFELPKENSPKLSFLKWIESLSGIDKEVDSFLFYFDGEEIASIVDSYAVRVGSKKKDVTGAVYFINDVERERFYSSRELEDLWYAVNRFKDREVVFDEVSGYYFVYEKKGYRGLFYVLSQSPSGRLPDNKNDFFIASCYGSSSTEIRDVSCTHKFLLNPDIMVSFSFSIESIKAQSEIKSYLEDRLMSWIR